MAPDTLYEIRVLGSLDRHWAAWFEGLQVISDGSQKHPGDFQRSAETKDHHETP